MTLIEKAKETQAVIIEWNNSPSALMVPQVIRGAILEMAALIVSMAQDIERLNRG